MGRIREGTCATPGPYGAHCTEYRAHRYSCYDAGDDVSFNERDLRDEGIPHQPCDDPTCHEGA